MGRGKKKSVEERINEKQELIEALKGRISKEQKELGELLQEKKNNDMAGISELLSECNMSIEDAKQIIEEYMMHQMEGNIA